MLPNDFTWLEFDLIDNARAVVRAQYIESIILTTDKTLLVCTHAANIPYRILNSEKNREQLALIGLDIKND